MSLAGGDIVITGSGVISPWGVGTEAFAKGLQEGRPALGPVPGCSTAAGGVADFDATALLGRRRGLRQLDRTSLLLAGAAQLALGGGHAHLTAREDCGVAIGSTFGTITSILEFDLSTLRDGPRYVSPLAFPNTVLNAPAARVAGLFGIRGANTTVSTGETSGVEAIIYALEWIRAGRARGVLAGSGFGLSPVLAEGFETPLGEGAALFVLEAPAPAAHAQTGVRVAGFGTAFLAEGCNCVSLGSAAAAEALGGAEPSSVDCVVASGRGPMHFQDAESKILEHLFAGSLPRRLELTPWLGDCLDASGGFQIAAALLALEEGAQSVLVSAFSRFSGSAFLHLVRGKGWS